MIDNKLFVVIAVLLVIFAGIVIYLAVMDRRLRRIEREWKENKPASHEN